jgi:hypothetical protein
MKRIIDLLFSYIFIILSVTIGGYSVKLFYDGIYFNSLFLLIVTIYLVLAVWV